MIQHGVNANVNGPVATRYNDLSVLILIGFLIQSGQVVFDDVFIRGTNRHNQIALFLIAGDDVV